MLPTELVLTADGPLRIVTLNRPERLNAFDAVLHRAMVDVWRVIETDDEARAVVITGAGLAFSAGGDVDFVAPLHSDVRARRALITEARAVVDAILGCRLPIVAAVNGPAVGFGCTIVTLCDFVVMADTAYLADPHVAAMAVVAGDGGVVSWPFLTSMLRAKEYLFTGDRIPAEVAMTLGLTNRVVPSAEVRDEAVAFAQRLAALPAQALQDTKRALNQHMTTAAAAVLDYALAAESESFASEEFKNAVERFRARS